MSCEQASQLADAVHNTPIYLASYEEHLWETILWDLQNFDVRGYDLPYEISLMNCYQDACARREKEKLPG